MFKRIILILSLILMMILPVFSQTGNYTTHNLFYLPQYGAYGLTEYNTYNEYMEITDAQIWANKLAFDNLELSNINDVDLTDIANNKILQYNSTSGNWECEDTSGGYTQEEIEDFAGAMWTGNTETLISIVYQDSDGTIDATVDDNLDDYDNSISQFIGDYTSDLTSLWFEGATANDFELNILIDDPTADRTIHIPNTSGTLAMTSALDSYYLKTAIDTLPECETIWGLDVTTSTELATALTSYYLKTAIDTQAEMETIWGVTFATDTELSLKAPIASPTFTGIITIPELGSELDAGAHSIGFTLQTATGDGTTTIDFKLGNHFKFTFGAFNETFTFTAPTKPCHLTLVLVQDATGGRNATWPASVKWLGTQPTWTAGGANKGIVVGFLFDATNYWGQGTPWEL